MCSTNSMKEALLPAETLWTSGSLDDWVRVKNQYYDIIKDHKVFELEQWYRDILPKILCTRHYLTKEQGITLIRWKGLRGKFRPALVKYAKDQDEVALQKASEDAWRILSVECRGDNIETARVMEALSCLTKLRGIGPATASAILSAMDSRIPFMSDEALIVCVGKRDYTVKSYKCLVESIKEKFQQITLQGGSGRLTVKDMEAVLFASSVHQQQKRSSPVKKSKKRKASSSS